MFSGRGHRGTISRGPLPGPAWIGSDCPPGVQCGLADCTTAHDCRDNYLLEIEQALYMRKEKLAKVFPIFLKPSAVTNFDYALTQYSEQEAYHPWARRPVRDTLEELFSLQGVNRLELVQLQGALATTVENVLDNLGKSIVAPFIGFSFGARSLRNTFLFTVPVIFFYLLSFYYNNLNCRRPFAL